MAAIKRPVDTSVQTAIANDHTRPFHIVKLELSGVTRYYSEGPQITHDANVYVEGKVAVSQLQWDSEGGQTCTIAIANDNNDAAADFLANTFDEGKVTVWQVFRTGPSTYTVPTLFVVGTCDAPELSPSVVTITVRSTHSVTVFMPNTLVIDAGFNHLPLEGKVVFWNNTQYELRRDYG